VKVAFPSESVTLVSPANRTDAELTGVPPVVIVTVKVSSSNIGDFDTDIVNCFLATISMNVSVITSLVHISCPPGVYDLFLAIVTLYLPLFEGDTLSDTSPFSSVSSGSG